MSATPWTVGRYVVETLAANGIDTVFGIPGVHNIELYRGLEFVRLRHVLVRHEQNAGFAALARSARVAQDVRDHLRAAFATLHAGRARPAYLEIPLDLLAEPTTLRPERFARSGDTPPAAPAALAAAQALLAEAQRPLIIAGGGARGAGSALRKLVEAIDGYLVTTVAGKGVIAESHPASLGASLPYAPTQELVAAADVVVAAGTELSETDVYTTTRLAMSGRLVRLDIDEQKLSDQFAADVLVRGDAGASLEMLAGASRVRAGWRTAAGAGAAYRARIDSQFDTDARARLAALRAIREVVPSDGVLFTDMTQIAYLGNYAFAAERPGLWFHPSG